jgi:two-component system NtrC family sensor kinase
VLTNLMGNAAKFTRRCADPQVQVSGQPDGEMLRLRVRDNGTGFDMAQAERLFKPFGRLHRADDHPGTGIGLTIVQRIVQRHGGEVRAHGEPGAGAWFECTLPLRPRAPAEPADGGNATPSLPSP